MGNSNNTWISAEEERGLLSAYQLQGDKAARNTLVTRLLPDLRRVLGFMYPGHPSPDDLFQDGCLSLMDAIDKYDLTHPARVRLITFVRKRLRGAWTRASSANQVNELLDSDATDLSASPDCALELTDDKALMVQVLAALNPRDRDILIQRRLEDAPMKLKQLAAYYGVSEVRISQLESQAIRAAGAAYELLSRSKGVPAPQ